MKPAEIIEAYDALIDRAIDALRGEPYHQSVPDGACYALCIKDKTARLTWPEAEDVGYDSGARLEEMSRDFPAELLAFTAEDFVTWRKGHILAREAIEAAAKKRRAVAHAKQKRAAKLRREQEERETFERLKAKYEPEELPMRVSGGDR